MDKVRLKKIAEELLDTFNKAGEESIKLYEDGLKILSSYALIYENKFEVNWRAKVREPKFY